MIEKKLFTYQELINFCVKKIKECENNGDEYSENFYYNILCLLDEETVNQRFDDIKLVDANKKDILLQLIGEIEFMKNDDEPDDEGYNLGLSVSIVQIKKKLKKIK